MKEIIDSFINSISNSLVSNHLFHSIEDDNIFFVHKGIRYFQIKFIKEVYQQTNLSPYPLYKTYIQFIGLSDNTKSNFIHYEGLTNTQINDLINLIQKSLLSLKGYEYDTKLIYHLRMTMEELNKLTFQQKEFYIYFLEEELRQNKNN
jgi:hypothetical protein